MGLIYGLIIGGLYVWIRYTLIPANNDKKKLESGNYVHTNEGLEQSSRDVSKIYSGELTKKEYQRRVDSGYYLSRIEDTYIDEIGSRHRKGETPVKFH